MEVMTIKQTAQKYGIPEHALRKLVRKEVFPIIKAGNRTYISKSAFEDFLRYGEGSSTK